MQKPSAPADEWDDPAEPHAKRLQSYTHRVTTGLFVLCNGVIVLAVYASGVNLEDLFRSPDLFNPTKDICLRYSWHKVNGLAQPIRLCYEWINLSDPSGRTHTFQRETEVIQGADGKLYFDHGGRFDLRVLILGVIVLAVVAGGVSLKRYLIERYRLRLDVPKRLA